MTKRLQVLLDEDEFDDIKRAARRRKQSVAAWVRSALREARETEDVRPASVKLRAIREATGHAFPTAPIEEMLAQIERGYTEREP